MLKLEYPIIRNLLAVTAAAMVVLMFPAGVIAAANDSALKAEPVETAQIPSDDTAMDAVPAKPGMDASADGEALKTPPLAPPEPAAETSAEPPVDENQPEPINKFAAKMQAAQMQQETSSPFVSDIPNLTAPFGEVTSFSLGLTGPGSKWRIYPHLSFTGIFDDNVYLSSSHKVSDFYFALSPGAGFSYGADESKLKLRADYTASFLVFAKESSQDTVDQNAVARISYALPKLTLGLNLGVQSLSGASVDVGDRVRRQIYYIGLTSNYVLDEKFSVDLNADETIARYNGLLNSTETRIQSWLNYQATGKVKVGIGALFGYLDVQQGPGQTYEELLGRVSYDATGKLILYASGGVDLRQSDVTTVSPVFTVGAAYSPFSTTTITADVHERIYGSAALVGQNYTAAGFLVTLNQQLRPSLSVFLSVGYENASYYAVEHGVAANRRDNYFFARTGPEWQIKPWFHFGSFYEFSNNASSGIGSRSFNRNRVGLQANFSF